MQKTGKVKLPEGKTIAVNIGCDFDAFTVWMTTFDKTSQAYMSRGEYGAEVAVPRILDLFDRYGIKSSFCIPGHTADTFPDACREIVRRGHEVVHHGYVHEDPTFLRRDEEERIIERGFEALSRLGVRPRGYRSPGWDFSSNTLSVLEEYGFVYDSSLMGNDFQPYKPRNVQVNYDQPNEFSPPSSITELPVTWYLDDFPQSEFVGNRDGMRPPSLMFELWKSYFDYGVDHVENSCFVLTTHPQTIGRPHNIQMLEQFIHHMEERGAWFATLGEIADATVFE